MRREIVLVTAASLAFFAYGAIEYAILGGGLPLAILAALCALGGLMVWGGRPGIALRLWGVCLLAWGILRLGLFAAIRLAGVDSAHAHAETGGLALAFTIAAILCGLVLLFRPLRRRPLPE